MRVQRASHKQSLSPSADQPWNFNSPEQVETSVQELQVYKYGINASRSPLLPPPAQPGGLKHWEELLRHLGGGTLQASLEGADTLRLQL